MIITCFWFKTARKTAYDPEIGEGPPGAVGSDYNNYKVVEELPSAAEDWDDHSEVGPFPTLDAAKEAYERWLDNDDSDFLDIENYEDLLGECEAHASYTENIV